MTDAYLVSIQKLLTQYPPGQIEVEIRYGSFISENNLRLGLSPRRFNQILGSLNLTTEVRISVDETYGDYRKTTENGQVTWIQKSPLLNNFDSLEYPYRISVKRETPASPQNGRPSYIRRKERTSFIDSGYRIDLTRVSSSKPPSTEQTLSYEFEVELVDISQLGDLFRTAYKFLPIVLDTSLVYRYKAQEVILKTVNQILGGRPGVGVDPATLTQSRNLKLRDMVYGGLVGNPWTSYLATQKVDGIRQILAFLSSGIWLITPPQTLNWVSNVEQKSLTGYILDGELVPYNKRRFLDVVTASQSFMLDICMWPLTVFLFPNLMEPELYSMLGFKLKLCRIG